MTHIGLHLSIQLFKQPSLYQIERKDFSRAAAAFEVDSISQLPVSTVINETITPPCRLSTI